MVTILTATAFVEGFLLVAFLAGCRAGALACTAFAAGLLAFVLATLMAPVAVFSRFVGAGEALRAERVRA